MSFPKSFESFTIGQLKQLHEQYLKCQDVIEKQQETIKKLKIKYPNAKVDEEKFDVEKFIENEINI